MHVEGQFIFAWSRTLLFVDGSIAVSAFLVLGCCIKVLQQGVEVECFGVNVNMLLMSVCHARFLRLGDLQTMSVEDNALSDGVQAMTLTAGAELPSSEEPTMSGTVNMVNDATNGTAMASESKNTQ